MWQMFQKNTYNISNELFINMFNGFSKITKKEKDISTLKNDEQLEWIRRMNNYKNCAEEIVYNELIFV